MQWPVLSLLCLFAIWGNHAAYWFLLFFLSLSPFRAHTRGKEGAGGGWRSNGSGDDEYIYINKTNQSRWPRQWRWFPFFFFGRWLCLNHLHTWLLTSWMTRSSNSSWPYCTYDGILTFFWLDVGVGLPLVQHQLNHFPGNPHIFIGVGRRYEFQEQWRCLACHVPVLSFFSLPLLLLSFLSDFLGKTCPPFHLVHLVLYVS